jgi:dihydroorotase
MNRIAILGGNTDVLIDGDLIAATGTFHRSGAEIIDATGLYVMPALVDLGVFATDVQAFARGGIARIAVMPDVLPILDEPGIVQRASLAAKPHLWVHPLAAATRGLGGRELAEFALMRRAGARGIATGRQWIADSGVMYRVLTYAASLGLTVIAHAEDGGLVGHAVATAGETATRHGLSSAPACAEAMAIARDLTLAEEAGAAIHFRQVTTAAGFALIRGAKTRGLPVTCGITPAHLLLSDIAATDYRTFARLSPPLRLESDRQAALAALNDGTIDVLCSGHDPRGPEAKRLPFADAAPGMAGAETLLTTGLGLVRDGVITLERLTMLTSANPARILGLETGGLLTGAPADIAIVNLDTPWQVRGATFSSSGNTPFEGLPVQGRAVRTIKGGRTIFQL